MSPLLYEVKQMPFKSDKQRAFMYSKHPDIAKKWRSESGPQEDLPVRAKSSMKKGKSKKNKAVEGLKRAKYE